MTPQALPRILLAGTHSGSGKTTVTCGLLQALKNRRMDLCAFKCGPDYIDPLFHSKVLGIPSRNLDLFLTDEKEAVRLLQKNSRGSQLAVVEGVMGYYDGLGGSTDRASAYDVARVTQTPAVLVVPARGASLSLAATVKGFYQFRENSGIFGVILNGCSSSAYPMLKKLLEQEAGIPVLGFLPYQEEFSLPSRHLGLTLPGEINGIREKLTLLARQCEETLDIDRILNLASLAPPLPEQAFAESDAKSKPYTSVQIAVARDEAFCFLYEDNLDLLRESGAEIVFFSPLHDKGLPEKACGLILPGGYPELFAQRLSQNASMRCAVQKAVESGMPTIAECGGFLYLLKELEEKEGESFPMAGVLPGSSVSGSRLGNFGYVTLTAQKDHLLLPAGESLHAHEFHYWQAHQPGEDFTAVKPVTGKSWQTGYATSNLYAGFPHLYFASNPQTATRFVHACEGYQQGQNSQEEEIR